MDEGRRGHVYTLFQVQAEAVVLDVLAKHGQVVEFQEAEDSHGHPWMSAAFVFRGRQHEIEIFGDSVVMTCGRQLFEPYMRREFISVEAQIQGFATRLDRYLSGDSWEGPDEWGAIGAFLARAWGFVRNWVRRG